jgi:hypothetical protein
MLSVHLRLGLPSGLFPSGFPTNILYTFLFSPIRAKCYYCLLLEIRRHVVRSCLRYCTNSQKVVGSTPNNVTALYTWPKPSSHTIALGSTQPLTGRDTRDHPGVRAAVRLLNFQHLCHLLAHCLENASLDVSSSCGPLLTDIWTALPLFLTWFVFNAESVKIIVLGAVMPCTLIDWDRL